VQAVVLRHRQAQDAQEDLAIVIVQARQRAGRWRRHERCDETFHEVGLVIGRLVQRRSQMARRLADAERAMLDAQQSGAHER
jgi:hypothetical protein